MTLLAGFDHTFVFGVSGCVALTLVAALFLFVYRGSAPKKALTDPRKYSKFTLAKKTQISHNTVHLEFALPSENHCLGLPVGKHVFLRASDKEGKVFSRAYTPVTSNQDLGHFDLVIKTYPQGKMSQHVVEMKEGEAIDVRGPLGSLEYFGSGKFAISRKTPTKHVQTTKVKNIGMIAGGTGITPMLQIARDIARQDPNVSVSLLYANVTEEDILLRKELDSFQSACSSFKCCYTLDKPPAQGWAYESGFVTAPMIAKHLPAPSDDTLILMCGPPPMMNFMEKNLQALDYAEHQYFVY